jgi:hypothetical protein
MTTEQLDNLNIALKEARLNFLANFITETASSLQTQGFTSTEILDAITNHAYINGHSIDTVLYLSQASHSSIQGQSANCRSFPIKSNSHTLES